MGKKIPPTNPCRSVTRHEYAKVPVWSSDGSLLLVQKWILDGETYALLGTLNANSNELRWSNQDPTKMFGVNHSEKTVNEITVNPADPSNSAEVVIGTFAEYERVLMGPWEGNVDHQDHYLALACKSGSDLVVTVFDLQNEVTVGTRTFAGRWTGALEPDADWVSMSPSGDYVVIEWTWSTGDGVWVWDRQLSSGSERQISGAAGHADINGFNEVLAVAMDGSQTVERWVHHHSSASDYDRQVFACPSPDGSKVMFASDWGDGVGDVNSVNSYVVDRVCP